MPSLIVSLLAERPIEELEALRDKARSEQARVDVEFQQFEEALALKMRRTPRPAQRGTPARPGRTQKRILDAVARSDHPISPAEIIAEMESHGTTPSKGSIHNTIGRLVKNGLLVRLGEGQYQLASQNGAASDADLERSENGAGEPPSTATPSQEGTQEVLGS